MAKTRQLSLDQLSRTPEFRALSVKQMFWLQTYIVGGGDSRFATQVAYATKNTENSRTMGLHLLKSPKIKAALDRFYNRTQSEILLDDIQAEVKASKPNSAARRKLLALEAKLIFGKSSKQQHQKHKKRQSNEHESRKRKSK